MQNYYNATDSPLELPTPKNQGTRIIGVGESFFGPNFYDQFVLKGLLARTTWGGTIQRVFVSTQDFTAADVSPSAPSRYKTNALNPPPGSNSSIGKIKFTLHYSTEATSQDPVHITYYFYCDKNNATTHTHAISLVGVLENDWRFPTWADLPDDFYNLSPIAQKEALLTKR
jgi:hypothetical protein